MINNILGEKEGNISPPPHKGKYLALKWGINFFISFSPSLNNYILPLKTTGFFLSSTSIALLFWFDFLFPHKYLLPIQARP